MAPPPIQYYDIPDFHFQDGTVLPTARIAYLDINPSSQTLALIPTCFKGTLHSTCNFSTGALRNHRVIVVALFGNGESASPSNTPNFPTKIDYRDCVAAQHALLTQHLGLKGRPIDIVAGFSMAGQCTWYWTAMYPEMVKRSVVICSSARTSGHNRQFLEGPASALMHSVDYVKGQKEFAAQEEGAIKNFECPRGIRAFGKAYSGWLLSAEWFDEEKWRELEYESQDAWDEQTTGAGYEGWYADNLLIMLRMWQAGDVGACFTGKEGSAKIDLKDALGRIETPVLLLPCSTDQYFRWEANEKEASMLKNGKLEVIPSIWGHVAGGGGSKDDTEWMDDKVAKFIQETSA